MVDSNVSGVARYRFTRATGTAEDLAVALRDGYNDCGRGEIEHHGHRYVWVEYVMDHQTAMTWYNLYQDLGMQRFQLDPRERAPWQ